MNKLYILYDAQDSFCLRSREWMVDQPALISLEFIPYQAPELMAKFEGLEPYRSEHALLAVSDGGAVYAGPTAFVMCLFVLEKHRDWAARFAVPEFLPFAATALEMCVSSGGKIPRWLLELDDEELAKLMNYQQIMREVGQELRKSGITNK